MNKEIKRVPLDLIEPDPNQPRKNFAPERLAELMKSIKRHGIKQPLTIEKVPGGKFIIQDGERRYRAAKELGLKEVPAIIEESVSDIDRLIIQFHLQEQHEGWSSIEKAVAVGQLAEQLKVSIEKLADILSLPRRTISDFIAFSHLLEKKEYLKNEISLSYAKTIYKVKNTVKNQYKKNDDVFDQTMERELEKSIIHKIKNGSIAKPADLLKIQDASKSNYKLVEKFIEDDSYTTNKLFLESKGKAAFHYRNVHNSAHVIASHLNVGIPMGIDNYFEVGSREHGTLKRAHKLLGQLLDKIG